MCDKHGGPEKCSAYIDSGLPRIRLDCIVNCEPVTAMIDPTMTLLVFLRKELNLSGTKEGCGEGECGACTIIMNGVPVNSCIILALEAEGAAITTVEGLSKDGKLSILQQQFIHHDALQCGFCTPGMLMSARALLDRNDNPDEAAVKEAIAGNFCRCTGYIPIISAILAAARLERGNGNSE